MDKKFRIILGIFAICTVMDGGVVHSTDLYTNPVAEEWVVFQISGQHEGEGRVCAVSNTFDDGATVYLAGNDKGLSHISIDYPHSNFKTGEAYNIRYTIPGKQSGNLRAAPLNDSLLVGEGAKGSDLSSALEVSRKLQINVEGQPPLYLNMWGIEEALSGYRDCLGINKPGEAVTTAKTELPRVTGPKSNPVKKAKDKAPEKKTLPVKEAAVVAKNDGRAPPPPIPPTISRLKPEAITAALADLTSPRPVQPEKQRYTEKLAEEWVKESRNYTVEPAPVPKAKPVHGKPKIHAGEPLVSFKGAKAILLQDIGQP